MKLLAVAAAFMTSVPAAMGQGRDMIMAEEGEASFVFRRDELYKPALTYGVRMYQKDSGRNLIFEMEIEDGSGVKVENPDSLFASGR